MLPAGNGPGLTYVQTGNTIQGGPQIVNHPQMTQIYPIQPISQQVITDNNNYSPQCTQ